MEKGEWTWVDSQVSNEKPQYTEISAAKLYRQQRRELITEELLDIVSGDQVLTSGRSLP